MKDALILVDLQRDFMPGGALPVPDGDAVVPVANMLQRSFALVVATQDWHPPDHGSFAVNHRGHEPGEVIDLNGIPQVLWPAHCIQYSEGSKFHTDLVTDRFERVFHKGVDPDIDSYSAFFDNGHRKSTGLGEYLREQEIEDIWIAGLATDYCVKYTVMDGLKLGFRITVVEDGCRGIDLKKGDVQSALRDMHRAGARIAGSEHAILQR